MSKRFDAILKHLPEDYPQDWAQLAGVKRPARVTVIDADVSTVTAAADKVLRVDEPDPWLLHLEFQASYDATLSHRLLQYNVLLGVRQPLVQRREPWSAAIDRRFRLRRCRLAFEAHQSAQ